MASKSSKFYFEDLRSGAVVFLVALPLCLGIAHASGAPLFSGILTGIVGGILVSLLSGSSLAVSGPAAGLSVIVLRGIENSPSFAGFLTAVVLSGLFQIGFGFLRAGFIGDLFLGSVIKGMLAGIGVIIFIKQLPHALGWDFAPEMFEGLWQGDFSDLSAIASALNSFSLGAILIVVPSLLILTLWEFERFKKLRVVPAPLLVVLLGVVMNSIYESSFPSLALKNEHLVSLPVFTDLASVRAAFTFPDFSTLGRWSTWSLALTIAVIGSIETLLSVEAIDRLDPQKRITPPNRELVAQGVGNSVAGLIGGIPMTAVIVRGSANVFAGGKTHWSSFIHGVLLLFCVGAIPFWLNKIPLASLAAVLLLLGYKLSDPRRYRDMVKAGFDQGAPFLATVFFVVFTDLLTGVLVGLSIGIAIVVRANFYSAISITKNGKNFLILFKKDHLSFLNKPVLKQCLSRIPEGSNLVIDGRRARFIDSDISSVVADFVDAAKFKNIQVELAGISTRKVPILSRSRGKKK